MSVKYDITQIRSHFPILRRTIYDKPLIYFDNAATTQKPLQVLDAMRQEYLNVNANVHRGTHYLSIKATELHEKAREAVRRFINARSTNEIIFTRGTTEGINLVAQSYCEKFMKKGDEVITTVMEHHSNIVPWQLQSTRQGIVVKALSVTDSGALCVEEIENLINDRTRLLCVSHVSNVLGTINPIEKIVRIAHSYNIPVLIDAAQSVSHLPLDVQNIDCDFLVFSGHKMYGPTGIGVLYGKEKWLDAMPPYQGGGEMIEDVSFEKTTFASLPYKFEAGTPDYIASNGLATAIDYIESIIGFDNIMSHDSSLINHCIKGLSDIRGMRLLGTEKKVGAVSFVVEGIHPFDMGTLLDRLGIAVRTGHHCAAPLMKRFGVQSAVRASFALYNTEEEIDTFIEGVRHIVKLF